MRSGEYYKITSFSLLFSDKSYSFFNKIHEIGEIVAINPTQPTKLNRKRRFFLLFLLFRRKEQQEMLYFFISCIKKKILDFSGKCIQMFKNSEILQFLEECQRITKMLENFRIFENLRKLGRNKMLENFQKCQRIFQRYTKCCKISQKCSRI